MTSSKDKSIEVLGQERRRRLRRAGKKSRDRQDGGEHMRSLQKLDTTFTVTYRLASVARDGQTLVAQIDSDYGGVRKQRRVDQVVVNHGTRPMDELYLPLKPFSRNLGAVEYGELIHGQPQSRDYNPDGEFQLFRIGDAVAARNTHAAIYDALRLVKDL